MPRGKRGTGGAPPIDPNDAALAAKSAPNGAIMRGVYQGLSPELADRLVDSVPLYPTYKTTCAANGCSDKTVTSWLRRGALPGADPLHADFCRRFIQANADHARSTFARFQALLAMKGADAGSLLKYMQQRWHLAQDPELLSLLDGGEKKSDNLLELLRNPTPRLRCILGQAGWIRHPAWGTPDWGNVINTVGHEAPPAAPAE